MKHNKSYKGWLIASVVINVFLISILSFLVGSGLAMIEQEEDCIDMCYEIEECGYYSYDDYESTCTIYDINNEVIEYKRYS